MSKKKKFKKKFRAEIFAQLQQVETQTPAVRQAVDSEKTGESAVSQPTVPTGEYLHIKKDLLRIVMITVLVLLILVIIVVLKQKTEIIDQLANTMAKIVHLDR